MPPGTPTIQNWRLIRASLAYGRVTALLYGWARFSVITTGSIALLSFVFGDYANRVIPLGAHGPALWAVVAVVAGTTLNAVGIRSSSRLQNILTVLEIGGLLLAVAAALWLAANGQGGTAGEARAPVDHVELRGLGFAMVFVLLTYGGWNEAAFVSAELESRVSMVRSLVLAVSIITALYLLVNWACWYGLGLTGMASSNAVAADLMRRAFGPTGETLLALAVAIAALTSINPTMAVGARSAHALACDWLPKSRLAQWDMKRGTPVAAVILQGIFALALVGVGSRAGEGFVAMVEYTAPVFWLFMTLAAGSLFILRRRSGVRVTAYRVPLFPVLPAVFCLSCAYMLWSSLTYVGSQSLGGINAGWIGVAVLGSGGLLLALLRVAEPGAARRV